MRLEEGRLDLRGEKIGREEEETMAVVEDARASMVLNNGVLSPLLEKQSNRRNWEEENEYIDCSYISCGSRIFPEPTRH